MGRFWNQKAETLSRDELTALQMERFEAHHQVGV